MKRTIALAIAGAALLGTAGPASAAVSATSPSPVTADVAPTLEATFPAAYAWGDLNAGTAGNVSAEQGLTVKSNQPWGVMTFTDKTDGKMTEVDSTGAAVTTPQILSNALQWRLSKLGAATRDEATDAFKTYTGTGALMGTTQQAKTDDLGLALGVTYKQEIKYADLVAAGTNNYKIVVNYDFNQAY
jgi:hypothetical protein